MYAFQQFKQDRQSVQPHTSRLYSPTIPRPRTEILRKVFSPDTPEKFDVSQYPLADFINKLQDQIRRLFPNFAFKFSLDPPLSQSLVYITQAIDAIIEEKAKIFKGTEENSYQFVNNSTEKECVLAKSELEKAKETNKALIKFEKVLKKKEEKLNKEKFEVGMIRKKLMDLEEGVKAQQGRADRQEKVLMEGVRVEKEKVRVREEELEKKIREFEDFQERSNKKVEESVRQTRYEREALQQLENYLNESKASLLKDQKSLTSLKFSLDQQKWENEQTQRKLEESLTALHTSQNQLKTDLESLHQQQHDLQSEKSEFQREKSEFQREKNEFQTLKKPQIEDKTFEFSGDLESDIKMHELSQKELQLEENYQKIQYHLENTSRELEERQLFLDEKELKVKFDNFRKIESSLTETKIQVEELKTNTIPDLENQSGMLGNLVREIQLKKNELEISIFKLTKEIEFVQKYKKQLDAESDMRERYLGSVGEEHYEEVQDLVEELEMRLKRIVRREEELEEEEERIEHEKSGLVETAEFLKKAHRELQDTQAKLEAENLAERVRIKNQMLELEERMKQVGVKEGKVKGK